MNDFEFSKFDEDKLYEDFWVMASYQEKDGDKTFIHEEHIGSVMLRKDIAQNNMPFELEINGTTYKRED